jgi:uncharacterized membrane protein YedE/YeeE
MDSRAAWYVVGPLLGILIACMLWATNRPLGALGGYIDVSSWLRARSRKLGFRMLFIIGVPLGALAHALLSGGLQATAAYGGFIGQLASPTLAAALLAGAGLLMGYGARTAGGCTSGHGLCGTALGSPASFVAMMTFMGTAVLSAHVLQALVGGGR